MRNTAVDFFADQLNTDPESLAKLVDALSHLSDKKNVLEHLYEKNEEKVKKIISSLKLNNPTAEELYEAIRKNIVSLNDQVFDFLDHPVCTSKEGSASLIAAVLALHRERAGFFIKRKVAEKLLRQNPPQNIMRELGYTSVEEMLENEDLFEIYAALRFLEEREWLNSTYITAYRGLTAEDFEERQIEIRVLDEKKWEKVTEAFVQKKRHPMSHLKELGLIFLVPSKELHEILIIYLIEMACHYLDEVGLYSKYIKYHSEESDFGEKLVSAIRGDVPDAALMKSDPYRWLVIQRYLFKENPNDIRLGLPHINPEALFHRGAVYAFLKLERLVPDLGFEIWRESNYEAAWFPSKNGKKVLLNFNLMDNVMSLMSDLEFSKRYFYHFHEALWNEIFINYFGVEKLEDVVVKHLLDGWFDIRKI